MFKLTVMSMAGIFSIIASCKSTEKSNVLANQSADVVDIRNLYPSGEVFLKCRNDGLVSNKKDYKQVSVRYTKTDRKIHINSVNLSTIDDMNSGDPGVNYKDCTPDVNYFKISCDQSAITIAKKADTGEYTMDATITVKPDMPGLFKCSVSRPK